MAITKEHIYEEEDAPPCMRCPFCESPTLVALPNRTYLICQECRRKVRRVLVSAVRTRMLLDAFDELLNHSYDDEISLRSESVREAFSEELRAQGFDSVEAYFEACRGREETLMIPEEFAKDCGLTGSALRALCGMLPDYDFGEGPSFFENVYGALSASPKLTSSQRSLSKQLEALSFDKRKSLSIMLQNVTGSG